MNKLLAILFLLGAIGGFGMSQRTAYRVQEQTRYGAPIGEPVTVPVEHGDKIFFVAFGVACMIGGLYFLAKIRQEDAP
jgi:hypothetical protein